MAQTERRVGGNTGGIGGIKRKKEEGKKITERIKHTQTHIEKEKE